MAQATAQPPMVLVDSAEHIRRDPSVCPSLADNHVGPSPIAWEAHKVRMRRRSRIGAQDFSLLTPDQLDSR
jgi:hypothetical protein